MFIIHLFAYVSKYSIYYYLYICVDLNVPYSLSIGAILNLLISSNHWLSSIPLTLVLMPVSNYLNVDAILPSLEYWSYLPPSSLTHIVEHVISLPCLEVLGVTCLFGLTADIQYPLGKDSLCTARGDWRGAFHLFFFSSFSSTSPPPVRMN